MVVTSLRAIIFGFLMMLNTKDDLSLLMGRSGSV